MSLDFIKVANRIMNFSISSLINEWKSNPLTLSSTAKSIFPAMIVSKKRSCSSTKKGSRSLDSHESLERFSICKVLGKNKK